MCALLTEVQTCALPICTQYGWSASYYGERVEICRARTGSGAVSERTWYFHTARRQERIRGGESCLWCTCEEVDGEFHQVDDRPFTGRRWRTGIGIDGAGLASQIGRAHV